MRRVMKIGLTLAVLVGAAVVVVNRTGTDVIAAPVPPPERAEVAALVDGNTFDVRFNDQITRVRLINVDTPAPATPNRAGACLGGAAAAQLAQIIPPGTPLTLAYTKDRYGRTAAAATTSDGRLVNAEVVRSGLAQVIMADSDTPVALAVEAAAQEARADKRGLHSADEPCTVAGQVRAMAEMVSKVPSGPPPGATAVQLVTAANTATDVRMAADELTSAFEQHRQELAWLVLDPSERDQLESQARAASERAEADETALRNAASVTANQDATRAAIQTEAALIARTLAKIRKAEADRAAAAASRLAAAREAEADALKAAQVRADAARKLRDDANQSKKDKQQEQDSIDNEENKNTDNKNDGDKKNSDSGDHSKGKNDGDSGKKNN